MARLLAALIMTTALATAQDKEIKPLKAGDPVPANFRAFLATDERFEKDSPKNRPKKMHDLVTDNGLNPVLAVFVRSTPAADAPAAKLARQMSELVKTYKPERLGAFVMFLTLDKEYPEEDGRDAKAKPLEDLAAQLQCGNVPFGLAAKSSPATSAWGLSETDEITIIFYDRMVVKKVWTFTTDKPPTEADLKALSEYLAGELKPKR